MTSDTSITINNPAPRDSRFGRFEIVICDLTRKEGRRVVKTGTSWHVRWRSDGNLRINGSTEALTSKRNAERAIATQAGVRTVVQDNDKMYAVLVDGTTREVRVIDERDPKLQSKGGIQRATVN